MFQGHAEYPLSARGRAEAQAVALRLARDEPSIAALWSSPLGRAYGTAEAVSAATGLGIQTDDRLKEIDIGEGSGLTSAQIRERFPDWGNPGDRRGLLPGQESNTDVAARIMSVIKDLLDLEGTTVAVTHGGFIGNLCRQVVGADPDRARLFRVSNCSITEVITDRREQMVLHRFNDSHDLNLA